MLQFRPLSIILLTALSIACTPKREHTALHVIPEPLSIEATTGSAFKLNSDVPIVIGDSTMLPAAKQLMEVLHTELPIVWQTDAQANSPAFVMTYDANLDSLSHEGYFLNIDKKKVDIRSAGSNGLFYAVETIRQLLPSNISNESLNSTALPATKITDSPRFAWRGMHLDVSRHFMPLEFIKTYIDYLAMHKLNVFHWHLTDGIGWRIEIKSHPELTDIGAWRKVKEGKQPWQDYEVWRQGDSEPKYGGYYTQQEIREVVAYAKERFITVLPEIELPGHSEVVMQCYPQLLCTNARGKALKNTGVYCASNPESYQLLEDIIDEVMELFPSEYIHIGGDEVAKDNWNNCAKCQRLMKKNKYDAKELQSHFVNHFDDYLRKNGRKLIGWHEILEGELSSSATIMYWGADNGTADCLKEGHPTVLTTGSHLYFDHYQSLSRQEPKAFGGYAPLKKVYDYEPVPDALSQEYTKNILGVQANIWTEYMPDPKQVEYMLFPRIAGLSEIAWASQANKSWPHFRVKMNTMLERYKQMGVNYAFSALRPNIYFELKQDTKQLEVDLQTELETDIYYTTDGTDPDPATAKHYTTPFLLSESATIKAIGIKDGKATGLPELKEAILHKAIGCEVKLDSDPYGKYAAQGGYTLVDADFGGDKWGNGKWVGFLSKDFQATLTFDQPTSVQKVALSCIEETGSGIYLPTSIEVEVSNDGTTFTSLNKWVSPRKGEVAINSDIITKELTVTFDPTECRYLRIKAPYRRMKNQGVFIFTDEIIVE